MDALYNLATLTEDEKNRFVDIAYHAKPRSLSVKNKDDHTLQFNKNFIYVSFNTPPQKEHPAPGFNIRFKIDRETGKIIETFGTM